MKRVKLEEVLKEIPYSRTGLKRLVAKRLIPFKSEPKGKRELFTYNIKEVKLALGIPPDRHNEKIITSAQADQMIKDAGIEYEYKGSNPYQRISTQLSRRGYLDSYYLKRRGTQKGINVLFLEKDVREFIIGRGDKLYEYRIPVLEKLINLLSGYAIDPRQGTLLYQWLHGELDSKDTREGTEREDFRKFRQKLPELLLKRLDDLMDLEKLIKERDSLKIQLGFSQVEISELRAILDLKQKVKEDETYAIFLQDLDFGTRAMNVLRDANLKTVDQLIKYGRKNLIRHRNLGVKTLDEISYELRQLGISW